MVASSSRTIGVVGRVALVFALLLPLAPVFLQEGTALQQDPAVDGRANPCASLPQVCRYKRMGRCCVADPRFDCFDVCFESSGTDATDGEAEPTCAAPVPASLE